MGEPGGAWLRALAEARAGTRLANVVWFGDSLSELDRTGEPMPWFVGRVLSGWTESVQYRNGGAEHTPSMVTTGQMSELADAGFGGRSVDLAPGDHSELACIGEGVTVLWSRRPGGGILDVSWGDDHIGSIDTDGPAAATQRTTLTRPFGFVAEMLKITAKGRSARLEGVYVHQQNLENGVRVWPGIRSGNTTGDYLTYPGWGLDSLASFDPDLVVVATGTNNSSEYIAELDALIDAIRTRTDSDIAVWVPYLGPTMPMEVAAEAGALAVERGCLVVDGAAALGRPSTVDEVHPTPATSGRAGAHAAAVLSGDPVGMVAQIAGQVVLSLRDGQVWQAVNSSIEVENPLGSAVLAGRASLHDQGHQWALLLEDLATDILGLPGSTLSFGPGGSQPIDTHLSRAAGGRLSLNSGTGEVELARLRVGQSEDPAAEEGAAVIYSRNRAGTTELAVVLPDGSDHAIAPAPVARGGYRAPLPCALAPSHHRSEAGVDMPTRRVHWVPFPDLAEPAVATHVWLEVIVPEGGASASAAIVEGDGDGRPGRVVARTSPGAIDLGQGGISGAPLAGEVELAPGAAWWVAVVAESGGGQSVVAAADQLVSSGLAQIGTAPVVPTPTIATGVLVLDDQDSVPDRPGSALADLPGAAPLPWVSLQSP
ncbi:MAG: SGNH/GDSL hydrolase family protein [Acidimicrobiales bacterium]|nr:SGNH/GDSL hydrolase family protein [Acidimicrobiales bacterium]